MFRTRDLVVHKFYILLSLSFPPQNEEARELLQKAVDDLHQKEAEQKNNSSTTKKGMSFKTFCSLTMCPKKSGTVLKIIYNTDFGVITIRWKFFVQSIDTLSPS